MKNEGEIFDEQDYFWPGDEDDDVVFIDSEDVCTTKDSLD